MNNHDDLTEFLFSELVEDSPSLKEAVYSTVRMHLEACLKAEYWPSDSHYCYTCGVQLKQYGCEQYDCTNCWYRGGIQ